MFHMAKVSNKELRRLQTVSLSLMSYRGHIPNMDVGTEAPPTKLLVYEGHPIRRALP